MTMNINFDDIQNDITLEDEKSLEDKKKESNVNISDKTEPLIKTSEKKSLPTASVMTDFNDIDISQELVLELSKLTPQDLKKKLLKLYPTPKHSSQMEQNTMCKKRGKIKKLILCIQGEGKEEAKEIVASKQDNKQKKTISEREKDEKEALFKKQLVINIQKLAFAQDKEDEFTENELMSMPMEVLMEKYKILKQATRGRFKSALNGGMLLSKCIVKSAEAISRRKYPDFDMTGLWADIIEDEDEFKKLILNKTMESDKLTDFLANENVKIGSFILGKIWNRYDINCQDRMLNQIKGKDVNDVKKKDI